MRMIPSLLAAFITLAVALPSAAADKEKLRSAARLPRVEVLMGIEFNTYKGVALTGDDALARVEAAALEKSLKGDASDADRLDQLGILYDRAGDSKKSREVSARAAELYRKQLETQSDNPRLLAQLGHALQGADDNAEAEKILRRTVQLAPAESLGWLNLGRSLVAQGYDVIFGGKPSNFAALLEAMAAGKVPPERLATGHKQLEEALACFDKAIALAPREPLSYEQRSFCRSSLGFLEACQEALAGKPANPIAGMFKAEVIPDLEQAIQLDPENYRLRGLLLYYYVLPVAFTQAPIRPDDKDRIWNALSEKDRTLARAQVVKLEELAAGNDVPASASACEILAMLEMLGHNDRSKAAEWLHRAVKLAPSHEAAWDVLAGLLASNHAAALVTVSEERVQYQDTARNRFFLAKAYEAVEQLDKAQTTLEMALQRDPKYFPARLGLAALLLRRNNEAASWARAGKLLEELAAEEATRPQVDRQSYAFTRAIYLGLCDKQADAQVLLQRLVEAKCAYDSLQTALDALAAGTPSP